jgi:hypothetical protein
VVRSFARCQLFCLSWSHAYSSVLSYFRLAGAQSFGILTLKGEMPARDCGGGVEVLCGENLLRVHLALSVRYRSENVPLSVRESQTRLRVDRCRFATPPESVLRPRKPPVFLFDIRFASLRPDSFLSTFTPTGIFSRHCVPARSVCRSGLGRLTPMKQRLERAKCA